MASCLAHLSSLVRNPTIADFEQKAIADNMGPHKASGYVIHIEVHSLHWDSKRKITLTAVAAISLLTVITGGAISGSFGSFLFGVGAIVLIIDLAVVYYHRSKHAAYEEVVAQELLKYNNGNIWCYDPTALFELAQSKDRKSIGETGRLWFQQQRMAHERLDENTYVIHYYQTRPLLDADYERVENRRPPHA